MANKNNIGNSFQKPLHPNILTSSNPKLAFVFPGQGSQSIGMLAELAKEFSLIKKIFAEASNVLGYDLWQLTQAGPEEELNQTEKTQPALLAGSVAIWRIWQEQQGATPALLAGHSLGEYSALVCANAIDFADAIKLVAARGRFMQEAVPAGKGAMAAIIGLDDAVVKKICDEAAQNEIVMPANYNAIGQIVISGDVAAVNRAVELAKQADAKIAKLIPVSVPSHCTLMKPAAERLAKLLEQIKIRIPNISVIHNVDINSHRDPQKIREALIQQLYMPVRWVETIQLFAKNDIKLVLECGAGKVLAGLNKRIAPELQTISINTPEQFKSGLNMVLAHDKN